MMDAEEQKTADTPATEREEPAAAVSSTPAGSRRSSETSTKSKKRRSSLFTRARMSWVNSGGQRGASVETLRGTHGADFEAKAVIKRGSSGRPCCKCFGKSERNVLILIKGPFIFVYKNESSQSPKYAVSLAHMKAHRREEVLGHTTVDVETSLGDCEYEITFHTAHDPEVARNFCRVVKQQAQVGEAEEVQKRLGHSCTQRKSVAYAENIAAAKVKDQPEKPVSAEELMANIPMDTY